MTTPGGVRRARRAAGPAPGRRLRIRADSVAWPAVAAAAFTLVVLLSSPLRTSLGWDEAVYASQISQHVPAMPWAPERARGMPLLVAPVTLLTGSVFALRCYLSVLAGIALFLALLAWRGTRPAWQLGVAGVIFGGLGVTQAEGAWQVYPNYWSAVGCLAGAGLVAQAIWHRRASWPVLAALAFAAAFTALMRPTDAVAVFIPLLLLPVLALRLRAAPAMLAIVAGLIIGVGEWVIEADRYFGGPLARMKTAPAAAGGTHLNLLISLRILNGDTTNTARASSLPGHPGTTGWSHPWLLVWWAALLVLVILGVVAARRDGGWWFALLPVIPALAVYLEYSLPVEHNVRYQLPAWALLAVPAADGIGWLAAAVRGRTRPARLAVAAVAAAFLVTGLVTQHALAVTKDAQAGSGTKVRAVATALLRLGVRAPCVVTSGTGRHKQDALPVAYYAHCAYVIGNQSARARPGHQVVVLVGGNSRPWKYARHWPRHKITGPGYLVAYISPRPGR